MKRHEEKFTPNPPLIRDYTTTTKRDFVPYVPSQIRAADPKFRAPPKPFETLHPAIDVVRDRIIRHSDNQGILPLRRILANGGNILFNSQLDRAAVSDALERVGVPLTPLESDTIWNKFAKDDKIVMGEFLRGLSGPMPANREEIALSVFDQMDEEKRGAIPLAELANRFDPSSHPRVVSGAISKDDLRKEYFDLWAKPMTSNVTRHEWLEFHGLLSCGIEEDRDFELLLRNLWHVPSRTVH